MKTVLVTGAAGFVGRRLVAALAAQPDDWSVHASDLRPPEGGAPPGVSFTALDLRDHAGIDSLIARVRPTAIVHLAAIVDPPPGMSRATMREIDVGGTQALVEAAVRHGVRQLIVTSSGAAYGYHPDNPAWIDEDQPLRGNEEFAYSAHKREVEALLAAARLAHPQLKQLVLRPGTVLGPDVGNQITAMFARPRVLGIAGSDSPFVFIWIDDVVAILCSGLREERAGIYNLAGDGAMSITEVAAALGKPCLKLPAWLVTAALAVLHPLGVVPWGPAQVRFLRYRPVLQNDRLRADFPGLPRMTSRQAFAALLAAQPHLRRGAPA